MSIQNRMIDLRRKLVRAGINPDDLPPFAITEEEFHNAADHETFPMENTHYHEDGFYRICGIRVLKGSM